ncbi:MAG TPA: peptidoglycan DD-metalloendopeptidase family protein [Bacteroidales bacterium]|nr:peptidoglycan DD-metalloendopeptidase family protein [Bacteroidales bacterium]HSA42216.1 peptidoglycan DD-metalloendopeptidase family protein [Bacteroidales bacterium]
MRQTLTYRPPLSELRSFLLLALVLILLIPNLSAQSNQRAKLEKNKKDLESEINYTNQLLNETRKSRQLSVNRVVILNNQIQKREKLINTINHQVESLYDQISNNQQELENLNSDQARLKKEYARMITQAYKNRNAYDRLMFIFAAKDFNQAWKRLKYYQQYSNHRKQQVLRIMQNQEKINRAILVLNERKNEKLQLAKSKETEKSKLTREKEEKSQTVSQLKQKENELKKKLREKERALSRLQKAIQDLIAEEIRKSMPVDKSSGKATTEKTLSLTPEEKELSSSFTSNRGKLPWPTEKGIVASTFGEHEHPVLKGIKTNNKGINILTNGGSQVRSVFTGTVTGTMSIPNLNNVVIIRHGEYLTVYCNLEEVYVKKGDKVKTKQAVGKLYTDPDESRTELHFELWEGKKLMDPLMWLAK